jgi:hypothetical protein
MEGLMMLSKIIAGFSLTVLLLAGCGSSEQTITTVPSSPEISNPVTSQVITNTIPATNPLITNTNAAFGPASELLVKTSNKYSNLTLEIVIVPFDANHHVVNVEGFMNAKLWENPASSLNGKGQLLQEWGNVQLSVQDYFEDDFGKWVVLKFKDFTPKEVQTAYLEVTIVTNNTSLIWEGEMPLTPGAA